MPKSIAMAVVVGLAWLLYTGAMTEVAAHQQPTTPEEHLAAWKERGRIPVPTRNGNIMDLQIHLLIEATAVNGLHADAVIHARASKRAPVKTFAVVFSDQQPQDEYPLPVLWVRDGSSAWVGKN